MSANIVVYGGDLRVSISISRNENVWSYTVVNDEPPGSPNSINTIHLEVGSALVVTQTPTGWAFDTDNSSFILWYSTGRQFDIPPGGSLSGFRIEGAQIELPTPLTVTAWKQATNEPGAVLVGALRAGPTAAPVSVSGRVVGYGGRGLSKAIVTIADGDGQVRSATTNPFGYYRFDSVTVGETYVFQVRCKQRLIFAPSVVQIMDERLDLNFTADAQEGRVPLH